MNFYTYPGLNNTTSIFMSTTFMKEAVNLEDENKCIGPENMKT